MNNLIETGENIMNNNDKILRTPDVEFEPHGGLGYELFRMMKFYYRNVAQINADNEGEEETYAVLLQKCVRTSLKMRSEGVSQGDIVCLCTYNHMNSTVPFLSGAFLGAQVASLDPTLSIDDTTHLLKQVHPKIIFLVPESIELIETSLANAEYSPKLVIFGQSDKYQEFEEYLREQAGEEEFQPVLTDPLDTAVIFFSSGTTGLPKGICQNSYSLLAQGINVINNGQVISNSLCFSSLYWISSALYLVSSVMSGTARVCSRSFNSKNIWYQIEKFKVTFMFLSPNQAIEMCKAGRPDDLDITLLEGIIIGGGSMSKNHMDEFRDLLPGTFVTLVYGQTEISGPLTCFKLKDVQHNIMGFYKSTSCGKPIRGIHYKVVDPETEKILGPHKQGELRVKSRFVMNGYYNVDSSDSFDADGWLKTGDIVYYDNDYCFYVVDRIKEMLKYKSWHIPPAVLENVVKTHRAVVKVVVIGIPDEEDGDHAMAVVIIDPKYVDTVTEEELLEFVNSKVPERQKLHGGVKFVDKVPTTPSGKVKRQLLKKMILNNEI